MQFGATVSGSYRITSAFRGFLEPVAAAVAFVRTGKSSILPSLSRDHNGFRATWQSRLILNQPEMLWAMDNNRSKDLPSSGPRSQTRTRNVTAFRRTLLGVYHPLECLIRKRYR